MRPAILERLLPALSSLAIAGLAGAGGPSDVDTAGKAVVWAPSQPVPYHTDLGELGPLSNASAQTLVRSLFARWQDVATATIAFEQAGSLAEDVDESNFGGYLGPFGGSFTPIGQNAVVFDADGAIFDALFGVGTTVAGFAGPTFFADGGGVTPIGAPIPPGSRIVEGIVFVNGRLVTGGSLGVTEAIFVHEIGHFSGLSHTQIHGLGRPASQPVETMFPFLLDADQATLGRDDEVSLSLLYPAPGFAAATGCVAGRVLDAEGEPFDGANVVATRVDDPADAVSGVSGSTLVDPGAFSLCGLQPGSDYRLRVEEIDIFHEGGSRVGPFLTPRVLPGPPELWSGPFESADPAVDPPAHARAITAVAGATVSGIDIVLNTQMFAVTNHQLPGNRSPYDLATADFDLDGRLDWVGARSRQGSGVEVYLGRGDGTFDPIIWAPEIGASKVVAGQLNADVDAFPDFAAAGRQGLYLFLGDGEGGFDFSTTLVADAFELELAAGDFNRDSHQDLVFLVGETDESFTVHTLLADGNGGFSVVTTRPSGLPPQTGRFFNKVAVGRFAGDPADDLVVTYPVHQNTQLLVLTNDGSGRFSLESLAALVNIGGLGAGDLNGDGIDDLAHASLELLSDIPDPRPPGPYLSLLLGDGQGGFEVSERFALFEGGDESEVGFHDVDGDGRLDVVFAGSALGRGFPGAQVQVGLGDGNGGIRDVQTTWGLARYPTAFTVGDFDGDGRSDLVVSDFLIGTAGLSNVPFYSVLLGRQPAAPSTLHLGGRRFQVQAIWQDFEGQQGSGRPMASTDDTGYFWFFDPDNIELVVKVLDGTGINGHFWVFFGSLSNTAFEVIVTDSETGDVRVYRNPAGQFASFGDVTAF